MFVYKWKERTVQEVNCEENEVGDEEEEKIEEKHWLSKLYNYN